MEDDWHAVINGIVFTSLYLEEAVAYCDANPNKNLMIEHDWFTGQYRVLTMD
jgi:hypothetical protein